MTTPVNVQMTPQGLLVPRKAIQKWLKRGLDVFQDESRIIIQPKTDTNSQDERVLRLLESGELLMPVEPLPRGHKPVRPAEQARLAHKLSEGRPLYEVIIEERKDRA